MSRLPELIDGVLLVDKEQGMTSHDVVALTRRCLNTKKVGHCGTLDPLATGLLLVVIGKATKIQDLLMSEDKEYVGTLKLGAMTDSQDADGQITEERPIPEDLTEAQVRAACESMMGDFYQTPPMVSAIKKDGVPLYKLARQGKTVEREARFVHVYGYDINRFAPPEVDFRVVCSKGFYVRTYAFDIGNILGCGAHLASLRRTKSGRFTTEMPTVTIDELRDGRRDEVLEKMMTLPAVSRLRGA